MPGRGDAGDEIPSGDFLHPHLNLVTVPSAQGHGHDRQHDHNSGADCDLALARHISILDN